MNTKSDQALTTLKMNRVKGVLCTAITLKDKALMLEKEIGLEPFYTMLSMGESISSLAASIEVSTFELEYMLQRTPIHRRQYMNALANKLAKSSGQTLERFKNTMWMDTEHASAAKHHSNMLERSLKHLNTRTDDEGGGRVVVNNTVVVRSEGDVPPLPEGLEDIIEGEYANIES